MAPGKDKLLANTDFPAYCVRSLGDRHFLIAGGGGQAKTGVPNAVEIYELKLVDNKVVAISICRHDTGSRAVMNCSSFYDGRKHHLATGEDEECGIYTLKYKVISHDKSDKPNTEENVIRKRKKEDIKEKDNETKQIQFDVTEIKHITTDFSQDGSFQKVVRFSPNEKILATGGADGHLRVWKYPECSKVHDIEAHTNDIDDIDISPCNKTLVTVSRDNTGAAWSVETGKLLNKLHFPQAEEYRFRSCRFGIVEGKKEKYNLYTINIPSKRSSKPSPCYLASYDGSKLTMKRHCKTGSEVLSSLAVSNDGIYIGVGTISGSVAVYISFSLQKLYYIKEAHSIFVTGVEFMPNSESCQAITGAKDFTLLSISADNTILLHQVNPRGSFSAIWLVLGALLIIYLLFWMLSELGL